MPSLYALSASSFVINWLESFQDRTQLVRLLTYETVEEVVKKRVEIKARIFGQDITINDPETGADPSYKIQPSLVAKLYGERIMPLTKEVQIEYLLRRLD